MEIKKHRGWLVLSIAPLLALAGCSGGGDGDGGGGSGGAGEAGVTYISEDGTCASDPLEGVDFEAASAHVAEYAEPLDGVLVDEPLKEPVTDDLTAVYLNNGTPIAAMFQEGLKGAADAAGIEFINVDTGSDAQSINSALNSVVEIAPDILFSQSVDAMFYQDQLQQLKDMGTSIVYGGQLNAEEFGLVDSLGGAGSIAVNSRAMAAGAITFTCGTAQNFVFYQLPELPSSPLQAEAFGEELAVYCPECTVRYVDISVVDPSPADKIVSDLQANPDTQFFVSMADQFQIGLQAKADLAGLTNAKGLGQQSLPQNLQQIADGTQLGGISVDNSLLMWLQLDEGLRRLQGMEVPYLQDFDSAAIALGQFITAENVNDYLEQGGFVANPNKEEIFLELWGVE